MTPSTTNTAARPASFQSRVQPWMLECFGAEIAGDMVERGDRFLEESLELLQSHGYERAWVSMLVDYVWGRPVGEPVQEVGGVMVTLAAYCLAAGIDMHEAGETELARILRPEIVEKIRHKQASKKGIRTPLPTLTQQQGGEQAGLPELPGPAKTVRVDPWAVSHYYTGNQMRAYATAALRSKQPCDMGEICIGCEPRNADGSCPDATPNTSKQAAVEAVADVVWAQSVLARGNWREVYIGHRCMRLEVSYEYGAWERLMLAVDSITTPPRHPADEGRDAELTAFVRGIYERMSRSYEINNRILYGDMQYLFDFATSRKIVLIPALHAGTPT